MPPSELRDGSAADFAAGSTDAGAYVARSLAGEVILTPKVVGEFTGEALPAGWTVQPWVEGGTGTLEGLVRRLESAAAASSAVDAPPEELPQDWEELDELADEWEGDEDEDRPVSRRVLSPEQLALHGRRAAALRRSAAPRQRA